MSPAVTSDQLIELVLLVHRADELVRIQDFVTLSELDVAGRNFAFLVHRERKLARLLPVVGFEFDSLQVENDVGHVLDHAGQGGEFMLRAGDFHRGNGGAFQGRKQDSAKRVADWVAVSGLKWFRDKTRIGFGGAVLVLDEGLRHFKTTVMNWHLLIFDFRFWISIEDKASG